MTGLRILPAALLAACAAPALAAERVATITSFDRIRLDGPYTVEVVTGRGSSARVSGDRVSVERVLLDVQGRTLIIRPDTRIWREGQSAEAPGPVVIRITTGELLGAGLRGSGSMRIDRLRGARASLSVEGSGAITVGQADIDRLDIALLGSGNLSIAGAARALNASVRGAATLSGAGLAANDLVLVSESAGEVGLAARTSAKVTATGSGNVTIAGNIACTVTATGAGRVQCGRPDRR